MPITSESCRSGELAQSAMTRSMSIEEKPGSWATTALEAPPLAPDAVPDVLDAVPPAEDVEPVASVLPEVPEVPEPASAAVEPDVPLVSLVPEAVEPEVPLVSLEPEAVEPDVVSVVEPVLPAPEAWFCMEPEAAWKPLT
jgi:hypothetical protein